MFWRKKKVENANPVQKFAAQLGIERRLNPRILYPHQNLNLLPGVFFGNHSMKVHDLSVGGACLLDKEDHMGPNAGQEIELRLIWPDCERVVRSRLVSRVDTRRHIQFLDLQGDRHEAIKSAIQPGVLGQSMRPSIPLTRFIYLAARELWTSQLGDSLTLAEDVHLIAELNLGQQSYRLLKEAWPVDTKNQAVSPRDVERMIIFLFNIPRPTPALNELKTQLQMLYFEGRQ